MQPVNLAIINASLRTRSANQADTIAITGGRIIFVGPIEKIRSHFSSLTQIIDAAGNLVLPGFIDNHTHFMLGGRQLMSVNLRNTANAGEFSAAIAKKNSKSGGSSG
jgi:hypothetical protein